MLYGKYEFNCRFTNEAALPEYKGSTLRGVFGGALRRVSCPLRQQACETCLLNQKCLYPLIFKTDLIRFSGSSGEKRPSPPPPLVIEPPVSNRTSFTKGDSLTFTLLLFGEVNHQLPYFVYAFEQTGEIGIGKKINGWRASFVLESVRANGRTIYSPETGKLEAAAATELACAPAAPSERAPLREMTIQFDTPLRLKHKNRLASSLTFDIFLRACLRRISDICFHYGEGKPSWDYEALLGAANQITTAADQLRWKDWERYSAHQKERMKFGGLTGSITFKGDLVPFLPLIETAEKLHIGKQTAFGLGKFRWIRLDPSAEG